MRGGKWNGRTGGTSVLSFGRGEDSVACGTAAGVRQAAEHSGETCTPRTDGSHQACSPPSKCMG